ncbi:MAG: NAD(P)-binding protein [Clostridiales bacterium]|nr:NAD(P)-binding protein [Clostridiales bacterium]
MIRVTQLKLPIDHTEEELKNKIRGALRAGNVPFTYQIVKQSLDARHREEKKFVYTVDVSVKGEKAILKKVDHKKVMLTNEEPYVFPEGGTLPLRHPPVIVGSGPAGLFCAWYLARAGYCPLVLERGEEAPRRTLTVERFWKEGILDPDSNVQFGEGGAGTFSDGKLNTLVKDVFGRGKEVLRRFVAAGAPEEILWQQKPHLGTDVLVKIVQKLRGEIEEMGGTVRFCSKMTGLLSRQGRLCGLRINDQAEIPAQVCVLALGHSARDTFFMLEKTGLVMEPKPFAVGVRVEHPQAMINRALYGEEKNPYLGPAAYKVTHTCKNGRGVYTFCMCPGGYVVNASSEPGLLAVNGMSYQARDGHNANSAVIVTVQPSDFPVKGAIGGVEFQRRLERAAWQAGQGAVPIQLYGDFCARRWGTLPGEIRPAIKGKYTPGDVRGIFPEEIGNSLEEGIHAFGGQISGFDRPDTVLCGVESRTSSPVRLIRDRERLTANIEGVYPCGEGAGYAGGITSAAMDGIKVAEVIAKNYAKLL